MSAITWHVFLYTCAVTGALFWAAFALLLAWVHSGIRRARKLREGQRLLAGALAVAEAEAVLRDAAGGAR